MTADKIAAQINELLADPGNAVIALSGSWGTGKTYLWQHAIAPKLDQRNPPLYVSIFGLRTISDIQNEIVQAATANNDPKIAEERKRQWSAVSLGLKLLNIAWLKDVIEALASFVVPQLIKERLLVLDDIERKGDTLRTDDVLGMIDRYKQVYRSRFVLILNRAKLQDDAEWAKYREKVIDHEVVLDPTAEEVFDIALKDVPCKYSANLKAVSVRLGLKNIRVVQRMLRIASKIFSSLPDLPEDILSNIVPSLVLLPAIYFKARDDLPTIEFVLTGTHLQLYDKTKDPEQSKWSSLLVELGIINADEFEVHLLSYLRSGLFHPEPFQSVVARYFANAEKASVENRIRQIFWDIRWNQKKSNAELCRDIAGIGQFAKDMHPATVTALAEEAGRLGDRKVSDDLLDQWISHYRAWAQSHEVVSNDLTDVFKQRVHPRIEAVQAEVRAKQESRLGLVETIKKMDRGWGPREIASLKKATKQEYIESLHALSGEDLALFLQKHLEWLAPAAGYSSMDGIGHALLMFRDAYRQIIIDDPDSRLATILRNEVQKAGITV